MTGQGSCARVREEGSAGYGQEPISLGMPVFRLPESASDLGWRADGVCMDSGEDVDDWWPEDYAEPDVEREQDARAKCLGCPVVAECLGFALATKQQEGLWGGLDTQERRTIAAQVDIKFVRHGTVPGYVRDECRCRRCKDAKNAYDRARTKAGWVRRSRREAREQKQQQQSPVEGRSDRVA